MTSINVSNLRKNLYALMDTVVDFQDTITVSTKRGNAVIISEEEYSGLMETLYLQSIPGMRERLMEGSKANVTDCDEFAW
jgi:PHD/YefM family antitoxin component YafN of YafNO toxin-antitoxin module